jgi:hypothetical protein
MRWSVLAACLVSIGGCEEPSETPEVDAGSDSGIVPSCGMAPDAMPSLLCHNPSHPVGTVVPSRVSAELEFATATDEYGCASAKIGPEAHVALKTETSRWVQLTLAPGSLSSQDFDLIVWDRTECTCVSAQMPATDPNGLQVFALASHEYEVIVESRKGPPAEAVSLQAYCALCKVLSPVSCGTVTGHVSVGKPQELGTDPRGPHVRTSTFYRWRLAATDPSTRASIFRYELPSCDGNLAGEIGTGQALTTLDDGWRVAVNTSSSGDDFQLSLECVEGCHRYQYVQQSATTPPYTQDYSVGCGETLDIDNRPRTVNVFSSTTQASARSSTWGTCGTGYAGRDVVYALAIPPGALTKKVHLHVTGLTDDLDLFVLESDTYGACDPAQCIGKSITAGTLDEDLTIDVTAGKTYYVVVDSTTLVDSTLKLSVECLNQ